MRQYCTEYPSEFNRCRLSPFSGARRDPLESQAPKGAITSFSGSYLPATAMKEQHLDQVQEFVDVHNCDLGSNEPSYEPLHFCLIFGC